MQSLVPVRACSSCSASFCYYTSVLLCTTAGCSYPGLPTSVACTPQTTFTLLLVSCYSDCWSPITADALQCLAEAPQMSFSPCICTGSSSVMSAVLWLWLRMAMCCQHIHQRAMVYDLCQILL